MNDRSKADWVMKSLAILQVTWFVAQIPDCTVHLHLVLFTLASIVCAIAMCVAWWAKPFDVRRSTTIQLDEWELPDIKNIKRARFRVLEGNRVVEVKLCGQLHSVAYVVSSFFVQTQVDNSRIVNWLDCVNLTAYVHSGSTVLDGGDVRQLESGAIGRLREATVFGVSSLLRLKGQ